MRRKRQRKSGLPPGTLVFTGQQKTDAVSIEAWQMRAGVSSLQTPADLQACRKLVQEGGLCWLRIIGLHDAARIAEIGRVFDLHPLALEDVLDTHHPPKMEDYESFLFLILKLFALDRTIPAIASDQVSMVVRPGLVISLEERPSAVFAALLERLKRGNDALRQRGSDYLAYALIDAVVDSYEAVLDDLSECLDQLQDEVLHALQKQTLQRILTLRSESLRLRHAIGVTREMVHGMSLGRSAFLGSQVALFLRDVYDHTVLAIDLLENSRDMLSGLVELYLSSESHRLNEVMKILTIISTIFIPLTFLVGVYGMNFHYMPELQWRWAYPLLWIVMTLTVVLMLRWFRHKRWL